MGIDFVKKAKTMSRAGEGDVTITIRGRGEGRSPYMLGVILAESGQAILKDPEFITATIVKEKDHIRCYFKATDKSEGFHGYKKNGKIYYAIPRIKKEDIQEMVGSYSLKFSKTYGFYYVEKETLNFIERSR